MPKVATDDSHTHFYKLVCQDLSIKDCYVGHTTNFHKRKHHRKNLCINPKNRLYHSFKYQFILENGGWDNWEMVLINTEPCENSIEAVKREREYLELLEPSLNQVRPIITREEGFYSIESTIKNTRNDLVRTRKIIMPTASKRIQIMLKNITERIKRN